MRESSAMGTGQPLDEHPLDEYTVDEYTVDEYTEAEVQRLLTEHPRLGEQGIEMHRRDRVLVLSGVVESDTRRQEIERLISEHFPGLELRCDIGVARANAPTEHEELR